MVHPPSTFSAPAARHNRRDIKGGRKRNNRTTVQNKNNNNNNNNNGNRQQRGGLNNQTLKVTIRNIINCESVKEIVDIIREILEKANVSLTTKILLDEASIQKLLRTEELIMEAKGEVETDATVKQEGRDGEGETWNDRTKHEHENNILELITKGKDETVELSKMSMADIVKGPEPAPLVDVATAISARLLYTILPHVSKRRGLKSGCAYLILQAPIFKTSDRPLDAVEAAKFTAIGRLQLALALESLVTVAKVEASPFGKAWRDKDSHRDRREGTISTTSDYKAFMAQQEAHSLEIQARSKPAPGGCGGLTSSSSPEQEEQLAAIVLHLRAKRAEQMTKQNVKKNVKKDMGTSIRGKGDSGNSSTASSKQNTSNNKSNQQSTKNSRHKPKQQPRPNKKAGSNAQVLPKSTS